MTEPLAPPGGPGHHKLWTMGLDGAWKTVANLTAMGLISLLFYQLVRDMVVQIKEERTMFREELRDLREANATEWAAIHASERAVRDLSEVVRKNQLTVVQVMEQIRETQKGVVEIAVLFKDNQKDAINLTNSVRELVRQVNSMKSPERKGSP